MLVGKGKLKDNQNDDDEPDEGNKENKLFNRKNEPWFWENEGKTEKDKWIGFIGNIHEKMKKNKLRHITHKIHPSYPNDYVYPNSTPARLDKIYKQFKEENNINEGNDDIGMHLHKKRMVIIVDRRHLSSDDCITDHIWMYEPPAHCRDIPNNAVPEWHISASKACLLPNLDYDQKEAEMGNQWLVHENPSSNGKNKKLTTQQQAKLTEKRKRDERDPNVNTAANSM